MSEEVKSAAVIDLVEARQERLHDIHEARLAQVRAAFEKALPLSKTRPVKTKKSRKKKSPKR